MTELIFKEKEHEYWYGDTKLTSVTQWLSSFEEPFDLKEVSKRYAKYLRDTGHIHVSDKKITAKHVKDHWDYIRDNGTVVHRQIEALINGEKVFPLPSHGAKEAYEYIKGELEQYPNPETKPEQRVCSLKHGLAGSVDLPVYYGGDKVFIYDWKVIEKLTPKKMKKYTLQLSAYAYILEEEYGVTVEGLTLVQVQDSGVKEHIIEYQKEKIMEMLKESGR